MKQEIEELRASTEKKATEWQTLLRGKEDEIARLGRDLQSVRTEEKKKIRENLEEAESKVRNSEAIIQENPIPMLIIDKNFHILRTNPSYEKLSGISRYKLLKMNLRDFDTMSQKGEGLSQAVRQQKKSFGEVTVKLPGGTYILEQYGIPMRYGNTSDQKTLVVYINVTKNRQESEEIQKNLKEIEGLKKESEIIIQENPMPILLVNPAFNIKVANQAYVDMSGISQDKLLSMNARDFKIIEQNGEGLGQVIKQKKRSYGEVTVELPSGIHILEQYGIPITDNTGRLTNILIVYNEVTAVREKEQEVIKLMEEAQQEKALLSDSVAQMAEKMNLMTEGDLTATIPIYDGDPLIGLKVDYNTALNSIRTLLEEVNTRVNQIENTSDELSQSNDQIGNASGQMALNAQESTDSTRNLMKQQGEIIGEISEISASVEEIAGTAQEVMEQAKMATEKGNNATILGRDTYKKMKNISEVSRQSVTEIQELNVRMQEINNIIRLIKGIAEQTNLLALNAAIEAAHAGEHGKGFAVVASEVRNLAAESKDASQSIENLIHQIQKNSDRTVASMHTSDNEIQSGIDSVNASVEALNQLVADIKVAAQGITEISKATDDQANLTNRVLNAVEQSDLMTKENMNRIEEVAAFAQELSASTEEVGRVTHEMNDMAVYLKNKMNEFKI